MGAQGAVNILYRARARRRRRPGGAARAERIAEYEDTLANPYIAAERGYVDAVIRPAETRLAGHPRAARAAHQAADPAAQEARQHPAVDAMREGTVPSYRHRTVAKVAHWHAQPATILESWR